MWVGLKCKGGACAEIVGLRKQITALKEAEGTKYRYLQCGDYDGTSKLYLYNESLNKGYLLILVI